MCKKQCIVVLLVAITVFQCAVSIEVLLNVLRNKAANARCNIHNFHSKVLNPRLPLNNPCAQREVNPGFFGNYGNNEFGAPNGYEGQQYYDSSPQGYGNQGYMPTNFENGNAFGQILNGHQYGPYNNQNGISKGNIHGQDINRDQYGAYNNQNQFPKGIHNGEKNNLGKQNNTANLKTNENNANENATILNGNIKNIFEESNNKNKPVNSFVQPNKNEINNISTNLPQSENNGNGTGYNSENNYARDIENNPLKGNEHEQVLNGHQYGPYNNQDDENNNSKQIDHNAQTNKNYINGNSSVIDSNIKDIFGEFNNENSTVNSFLPQNTTGNYNTSVSMPENENKYKKLGENNNTLNGNVSNGQPQNKVDRGTYIEKKNNLEQSNENRANRNTSILDSNIKDIFGEFDENKLVDNFVPQNSSEKYNTSVIVSQNEGKNNELLYNNHDHSKDNITVKVNYTKNNFEQQNGNILDSNIKDIFGDSNNNSQPVDNIVPKYGTDDSEAQNKNNNITFEYDSQRPRNENNTEDGNSQLIIYDDLWNEPSNVQKTNHGNSVIGGIKEDISTKLFFDGPSNADELTYDQKTNSTGQEQNRPYGIGPTNNSTNDNKGPKCAKKQS